MCLWRTGTNWAAAIQWFLKTGLEHAAYSVLTRKMAISPGWRWVVSEGFRIDKREDEVNRLRVKSGNLDSDHMAPWLHGSIDNLPRLAVLFLAPRYTVIS